MEQTQTQPFVRPRTGRVITGVTSALANRTGIDRLWIRAGFVALTFVGGLGLVAYALATAAIRSEGEQTNPFQSWIVRFDQTETTGRKVGWWLLSTLMLAAIAAVSLFQGPFVVLGLMGLGAWLLVRPTSVEQASA